MDINKKQLMSLPLLDKFSSRKEWELACWRKISKSYEFLELLTTSNERHNLVMRAAILKELLLGKGPRLISRKLFVSLQTISVVKKAITENNYRSYLERSKKERKKKEYSVFKTSERPKRRGWPRRTKYGTIYIPY